MNILLVENDYVDTMNVQRVFKKINLRHELVIARNGQEGLDILEKEYPDGKVPDLILLDLNMPKMNGLEFLKIIREKDKYRNVKVFVMTTSDEESDRMQAAAYNITGYVIKPLSFDKFDNPSSSMDSFNLLCELIKDHS
jgi:CheY-like chemotaxis protein